MKKTDKAFYNGFDKAFLYAIKQATSIIEDKITQAQNWPNQTKAVQDYTKGLKAALEAVETLRD